MDRPLNVCIGGRQFGDNFASDIQTIDPEACDLPLQGPRIILVISLCERLRLRDFRTNKVSVKLLTVAQSGDADCGMNGGSNNVRVGWHADLTELSMDAMT